LGNHIFSDRLAAQKHALQIYGHRPIPNFFFKICNAAADEKFGVIDSNVNFIAF
jgi:hypothetical protein